MIEERTTNTINSGDIDLEYEKQKELTKLMHQMEDGQITEDEFNEEVLKLQNIIESKDKKQLVDINIESELGIQKKEDESYKNYFGNHKKEFRNILGI
jgi:hypothetical protein